MDAAVRSPAGRMPLNAAQTAAVNAIDGALLVLSGAGTGKTTVVINRIVEMLKQGCAPEAIMGVTFTRKAADEMKSRLAASVSPAVAAEVLLDTFHSISLKLLRSRPEIARLTKSFQVADRNHSLKLVRAAIDDRSAEIEARIGADLPDDPKLAQKVVAALQRFKDSLVLPFDDEVRRALDPEEALPRRIAALLYPDYQSRLRRDNLADFGDLLLWPAVAMEKDEGLRLEWASRWRHLNVDEAQDSNLAQQTWMKALARDHNNICCVGDDDQTIHEWRGACPDFILNFPDHFPRASIIRLEKNYRSTSTIVGAGAALIANNTRRHAKTLQTDAAAGERIGSGEFHTAAAEAYFIARELKRLRHGETAFVLYRSNFQSRAIEEALIERGVHHRVFGSPAFYSRSEVRDAIALAVLAQDPSDGAADAGARKEAFERAANLPPRGLGQRSMDAILKEATAGEDPLAAGLRLVVAGVLRSGPAKGLAAIASLRLMWSDCRGLPLGPRLHLLLQAAGYPAWLDATEDDAHERHENLAELSAVASESGTLPRLLERQRQAVRVSDEEAAVGLMTMHRSKGLEADWVFLPSWTPGVFPPKATMDLLGTPAYEAAIESERRLAHVGVTRARHRCWITWLSRAGPSGFVDEIPVELMADMRQRRNRPAPRTDGTDTPEPLTAGDTPP